MRYKEQEGFPHMISTIWNFAKPISSETMKEEE